MASGGVLSPNDPLDNRQYSPEELSAIVDEATAMNIYAAAHAYAPEAIRHAMACGVHTIEHGNLLDHRAANAMRESGAIQHDAVSKAKWAELRAPLPLPCPCPAIRRRPALRSRLCHT